jgi:hypothetical protein
MYCRKCGNKLGDKDRFCPVCGAPTGYREPSAAPAESAETNEEIIFNPPYETYPRSSENELRFAEEDFSGRESGEENLKNFISQGEIEEEQKSETEEIHIKERPESGSPETGKTGPARDSEFVWNIHDFPKPARKTEDAKFNWNMDEYSRQEEKAAKAAAFEEELFQEMEDDARRIREKNIDRFFTFSRKNEEFQELLDKEYEKFRTRSRSMAGRFTAEAPPEIAEGQEELGEPEGTDIEKEAEGLETEGEPAALKESAESEIGSVPVTLEAPEKPETIDEPAEPAEIDEPEEAPEQETDTDKEAAPVDQTEAEEEKAEIKTEPQKVEPKAAEAAAGEKEETAATEKHEEEKEEKEVTAAAAEEQEEEEEEEEETETEALSRLLTFTHREYDGQEDLETRVAEAIGAVREEDEEQPKGKVWRVLFAAIAVILALEIAILGIRYFAPDSAAADAVNNAQTKVIQTVSGWVDGIKALFSGKDSDEGTITPENGNQEAGSGSAGGTESGEGSVSTAGSEAGSETPDPNPTADKNALVSSQMGNNANIGQVKGNDALAWQKGKNYGIADLNNSKPIENNVWQSPEKGEPVYYDESVVGAVIAFDSQWIDYVNGGNKNVLNLLKKDSEAYRKTTNFSRLGKIKETFSLLEIGEIRQGSNGFYVWAHEEIRVTENGKATDKKYNWIYYLEPEEGKMKIVNYYNAS